MDLKALRSEALEATRRFFIDRDGILPDEGSDEWEAEYHRQFELAKRRAATSPVAAGPSRADASSHAEWPELTGAPGSVTPLGDDCCSDAMAMPTFGSPRAPKTAIRLALPP